MSRTKKHQVSKNKSKKLKHEKGTKTIMLGEMLKELENDDYQELDREV